jgi:ABC-type sulfate/molybdate transport systems ATPase subunit
VTTLSITALAKSFRAGTPGCSATASVLRNVHLTLWPGEIVTLEGARGSGKSTLLRCAAGMLRPDSGAIFWLGSRSLPRGTVAYLSARGGEVPGALYSQLAHALAHRPRLLLLDAPSSLGTFERTIIKTMLRRAALTGCCALIASDDDDHDLLAAAFVARTVTLEHGVLTQRRKRSAARIAASSPAARARSSARSTYGRSLRSPQ